MSSPTVFRSHPPCALRPDGHPLKLALRRDAAEAVQNPADAHEMVARRVRVARLDPGGLRPLAGDGSNPAHLHGRRPVGLTATCSTKPLPRSPGKYGFGAGPGAAILHALD